MSNSGIPRFRTHCSFKPANLKAAINRHPKVMKELIHREPSTLQPKRDQVQKVDKLAEYNALRGRVLTAQITQLFYKGLYLRTRSPCVNVQTAKDSLPRCCRHFQLQGWCIEIDCESEVTDRANRLHCVPVKAVLHNQRKI